MAPLPGGKNALFEKAAKNMKGVSDCSVGFSETLGTIKCSLFTNKSYIRRYDEEDSSWKSVCNVQGCIDDQDVCKAVFKHALTHNANKQQLVKYKNKLIAKSCQSTKNKPVAFEDAETSEDELRPDDLEAGAAAELEMLLGSSSPEP